MDRDLQFSFFQKSYEDANVFVRNMNSDEVLLFALETAHRVQGNWIPSNRYLELENKRKKIYRANSELRLHPTIIRDPDTMFASCFYETYPNFLDGFD